ncbi:hypothetical protein [Shewanella surugensis]|uniref:Uncharacterized protein n=1 Tax=Shewanella surugensis TaxID=212020 RepID=A0ABT0LI44_9GAMM|nr:hypothetical protein [Shewanella surugensis]MCL1127372.1 hypothetical protein [Shewanella surugensis]
MGNIIAATCSGSSTHNGLDYDDFPTRRAHNHQTTDRHTSHHTHSSHQNTDHLDLAIDFDGASNFEDFLSRSELALTESKMKQAYFPQTTDTLAAKALVHQPSKDVQITYDNARSDYRKLITNILNDNHKSPEWLLKMMARWEDKNPISNFEMNAQTTVTSASKAIEFPQQAQQAQVEPIPTSISTPIIEKKSVSTSSQNRDISHNRTRFDIQNDRHKPEFASKGFFSSLLSCFPFIDK